jgi:hypothetical protein
VPCDIPVAIESAHRRFEGCLRDLSVSGAFVAVDHPAAERTPLTLRFALAEQTCAASARVAWRTGPNAPPWLDRGMGVEFLGVPETVSGLLRRTVAEQLRRFHLTS